LGVFVERAAIAVVQAANMAGEGVVPAANPACSVAESAACAI
jgi:hypothetical protein